MIVTWTVECIITAQESYFLAVTICQSSESFVEGNFRISTLS